MPRKRNGLEEGDLFAAILFARGYIAIVAIVGVVGVPAAPLTAWRRCFHLKRLSPFGVDYLGCENNTGRDLNESCHRKPSIRINGGMVGQIN